MLYCRVWSKNDSRTKYITFIDTLSGSIPISCGEVTKEVGCDIWNKPPSEWPESYILIPWSEFKEKYSITIDDVLAVL